MTVVALLLLSLISAASGWELFLHSAGDDLASCGDPLYDVHESPHLVLDYHANESLWWIGMRWPAHKDHQQTLDNHCDAACTKIIPSQELPHSTPYLFSCRNNTQTGTCESYRRFIAMDIAPTTYRWDVTELNGWFNPSWTLRIPVLQGDASTLKPVHRIRFLTSETDIVCGKDHLTESAVFGANQVLFSSLAESCPSYTSQDSVCSLSSLLKHNDARAPHGCIWFSSSPFCRAIRRLGQFVDFPTPCFCISIPTLELSQTKCVDSNGAIQHPVYAEVECNCGPNASMPVATETDDSSSSASASTQPKNSHTPGVNQGQPFSTASVAGITISAAFLVLATFSISLWRHRRQRRRLYRDKSLPNVKFHRASRRSLSLDEGRRRPRADTEMDNVDTWHRNDAEISEQAAIDEVLGEGERVSIPQVGHDSRTNGKGWHSPGPP